MSIAFCLWTGRSEKAQGPQQHKGSWQGNRSTLQEVMVLQQHEMLAWLFSVIPACPVCVFAEGVCHSGSSLVADLLFQYVLEFAPGRSGAALYCYLHMRNKLMCECGHRECFGWIHWTKWPQTSNCPAGHPKQAVLHGIFEENSTDSTCSDRDLSKTQDAYSTQVVWLQIEAFENV